MRGRLTETHLQAIKKGISSPVGLLNCLTAEILGIYGPKTHLRVVVDEGKNRHLRRLFGALKDELHHTPLKVLDLKRVKFASLSLDLISGQWRFLSNEETLALLKEINK